MPPKTDPSALGTIKPLQNSLAAFKPKPKSPIDLTAPKKTPARPRPKAPVHKKAGRKAKPVAEKESETIVLKLKRAEKAMIKDKAGLVGMGTYVKHILRTKTDLLG